MALIHVESVTRKGVALAWSTVGQETTKDPENEISRGRDQSQILHPSLGNPQQNLRFALCSLKTLEFSAIAFFGWMLRT